MPLAQGNNTPTRPRIEPGSPDPESDALTTRPVRSPRCYVCSMERICLTVSEKMSFKNVDGRTNRRRMPVYTISSPMSLRLR